MSSYLDARLRADNPWWGVETRPPASTTPLPEGSVARAVDHLEGAAGPSLMVLAGPAATGKGEVLLRSLAVLLQRGAAPKGLCYLPLDQPLYGAAVLTDLIEFARRAGQLPVAPSMVLLDRAHMRPGWETELDELAARYTASRILVTSDLSWQGPTGPGHAVHVVEQSSPLGVATVHAAASVRDVRAFESAFIAQINRGHSPWSDDRRKPGSSSHPGPALDTLIQVLTGGLPGLCGIGDPCALRRVFLRLAQDSGGEFTLPSLAADCGLAKNSLRKYLDFLERAFLIFRLARVDGNAKGFARARAFRAYLAEPKFWPAVFGPVTWDHADYRRLVSGAIVAQARRLQAGKSLAYARWPKGRIDLVLYGADGATPMAAIDLPCADPAGDSDYSALLDFARHHGLAEVTVATRRFAGRRIQSGVELDFVPAALLLHQLAAAQGHPE